MKIISRLTAEQFTFVALLLIGALAIYFNVPVRKQNENFSIPDTKVKRGAEQSVQPPNFINSAMLSFRGRNPFLRQREMELTDIPKLPLIVPPRENIALPTLMPYPYLDKFRKFYYFKVGGVIKEELLIASELGEIKTVSETEENQAPDRRKEREREKAIVYVKDRKPIEGLIVFQNSNLLQISTEKLGTMTINKSDVQKVDLNWTFEEKYKHDTDALKPDDSEGHYKLYKWCLSMGMIPEAIEELKKAVAINKQFFDAYNDLAELYRRHSDFDNIIRLYNQAIEVTKFDKLYFLNKLGNTYMEIGLHEDAIECFKSMVEEIPGNEEGRIGLAKSYIKLGMADEAFRHANKAVEYNGNSAIARQTRALAYFLLGNIGEAKKDAQKASQLGANNSEILNLLGVLDFLSDFYKNAAEKFYLAIKQNQYEISAWLNLGILYIMNADYNNAEIILNNAIGRDPTNSSLTSALAICQIGKGNKSDAIKNLQEVLQIDSESYYANYALGVIGLSNDNLKDAQASFEKAVTQSYFYLPAHYNAAITYFKQGNYDIASVILKNLLELDPTRKNARMTLGLTYLGLGNFEEAEKMFLRMRQEEPNDAQIWDALGYVNYYWGDNDPEKRLSNAKTFFESASKFSPADKYAQDAIAMISDFLSKTMFQDTFKREDSNIIGKGWSEVKKYGVEIKIKKGKCVFEGVQKVENLGATVLERKIPANAFISLETTLQPENISDAEAGIALDFSEPSKGTRVGLHVFFNIKGKLAYGIASLNDKNPPTTESKYQPPANAPVNIAIKKLQDDAASKLSIFVNGQMIDSVPLSYSQTESWHFSIFGRGLRDKEYRFAVDNVRIYEKRPEKRNE